MVQFFQHLQQYEPGLYALVTLAFTATLGLAVGNIKIRGIGMGVAGVLFVGIALGHFGVRPEAVRLQFAREIGLALCVYAIGIQVGPGFFSSLLKDGLKINIVAGITALAGVGIAIGAGIALGIQPEILAGIYSGAITNTPGLAAVQTTLARLDGVTPLQVSLPGMGYAVAYPIAVASSVLVIVFARALGGWTKASGDGTTTTSVPQIRVSANILITNPEYGNITLARLMDIARDRGLVITRRGRQGQVVLATPETDLQVGDTILAVGKGKHVDWLRATLGRRSEVDLRQIPSDITVAQIAVTKHPFIQRDVVEAQHEFHEDVKITRVRRGHVELAPKPGVVLMFGDIVQVVGSREDVGAALKRIGDPPREIEKPKVGPFFLGLAIGMLIGAIEIPVPGLAAPLRLGLAGGPLLVALILGRVGRIGPMTFQIRPSTCDMLRDLGLAIFIAAVGLKAGENFVESVTGAQGLRWMLCAALISVGSLLTCLILSRYILKSDVESFSGLSAGCHTNPTALAFAAKMSGTSAASRVFVAYATAYPLIMIIRVISAQVMILLLLR
jgi:putative transport protein